LAALLATGASPAGIVGSTHDFSAEPWSDGEICVVCHLPHESSIEESPGDGGLLWSHALSTSTYLMYTSPSLDGAQDPQPTGTSKMCLCCHDGTVALDYYGSNDGGEEFIPSESRVPADPLWHGEEGDLSTEHPISIVYDESADPDLHSRENAMGVSGTIADVLEGGTKLQCHSCHDVHDEENLGTPLLRVSPDWSQLCLTCHDM
jgi:hypothetical protein